MQTIQDSICDKIYFYVFNFGMLPCKKKTKKIFYETLKVRKMLRVPKYLTVCLGRYISQKMCPVCMKRWYRISTDHLIHIATPPPTQSDVNRFKLTVTNQLDLTSLPNNNILTSENSRRFEHILRLHHQLIDPRGVSFN